MATLSNVPAYNYGITFAGVPFVTNTARIVQLDGSPSPIEPGAKQQVPGKHQSEVDLMDEIDRVLPQRYLQDFALPPEYPGRNLGAIASPYAVGPFPNPGVRVGDWYYPNGAARWSVFRGLMTSRMVKEVLSQVQGGTSWLPKTFSVRVNPSSPDNPDGSPDLYTIQTSMYLLPPRPLAANGGGFDGLYLVTLVDERYYWQFLSASLAPTNATTWDDLLDEVATALGVTLDYSPIAAVYSRPEPDSQFWANAESAATLLDAIAFNVGRVVVREMNGTISLLTAAESQLRVDANRIGNPLNASVSSTLTSVQTKPIVLTAGGDVFQSGFNNLRIGTSGTTVARNAIIPATIEVTFPRYVAGDDPVPHFLNPRYANQRPSAWYEESHGAVLTITVPLASGNVSGGVALSGLTGVAGVSHTLHATAKAISSGETTGVPVNASGLNALSMQLAADYWGWQVGAALDECRPGTYAWQPEGFHDVIWTVSDRDRQAVTRVLRTEWNQIVREFQHSSPQTGDVVFGTASSGTIYNYLGIDDEGDVAVLAGTVVTSGTYVSGSVFDGSTGVPRGVGGPSVAQSWLAGNSGLAFGPYRTIGVLTSGGTSVTLNAVEFLPANQRWRGTIGGETVLFEGTSGGIQAIGVSGWTIDVAFRGIDGTRQGSHASGESVRQLIPDATWGVNLVSQGRGAFAYPRAWTSGGVQEAVIVPQVQTILALDGTGRCINGITHYSGQMITYDPTLLDPFYEENEYVWLVERNAKTVTSGSRFGGQFVGYSAAWSSGCSSSSSSSAGAVSITPAEIAPVYLINDSKYCCEGASSSSSSSSSESSGSSSSGSSGSSSSSGGSSSSSAACPSDTSCVAGNDCCPCISTRALFTLRNTGGETVETILLLWTGTAYTGTLSTGASVEVACVLSTTIGPSGSTNTYKWNLSIDTIPAADQSIVQNSCDPLSILFPLLFQLDNLAKTIVYASVTGCPCSSSSCSSSSSSASATCVPPVVYYLYTQLTSPTVTLTLTSSGSTITGTFSGPPSSLLSTGDIVTISGSTTPGYNGMFTITSTGPTTFTYSSLSTPPSSPAVPLVTITAAKFSTSTTPTACIPDPNDSSVGCCCLFPTAVTLVVRNIDNCGCDLNGQTLSTTLFLSFEENAPGLYQPIYYGELVLGKLCGTIPILMFSDCPYWGIYLGYNDGLGTFGYANLGEGPCPTSLSGTGTILCGGGIGDADVEICAVDCGCSSSSSSGITNDCVTVNCNPCCTAVPRYWKITVSGITDGTCPGCELMNGTFTLGPVSDAVVFCVWQSSPTYVFGELPPCYDSAGNIWQLFLKPSGIGGNPAVLFQLVGSDGSIYELLTDTPNCYGDNVLSIITSPGQCANRPTTITITPLTPFSTANCVNNVCSSSSGSDCEEFVADGTYTPTFTGDVLVEVWGAGGGGQGSNLGGAGGGGGGYSTGVIAVTSGTPYAVTVGVGGASDTAGGMSQFESISAGGGNEGAGGVGGTGGTGDFTGGAGANAGGFSGGGGGGGAGGSTENGHDGSAPSGGTGGAGGAGGVVGGGDGGAGGTGVAGSDGTSPGGGGGGCGSGGPASGGGGSGADGLVRICRV